MMANLTRTSNSDRSTEDLSPRAELSGLSGLSGIQGSPGTPDLPELETTREAMNWSGNNSLSSFGLSISGSPFLASPETGVRVISLVSSSSSSSSSDGSQGSMAAPIRVAANLRQLLGDCAQIYCDDAALEEKLNEVVISNKVNDDDNEGMSVGEGEDGATVDDE